MLLKSENYENLSKIFTVKFDEENIIRCDSRLQKENKNSHPIMLSRNELTKLIALRCHICHDGVKQTLNELQTEFRTNCGKSYVRKLVNSCISCKRL